jgi:hypothetical protein
VLVCRVFHYSSLLFATGLEPLMDCHFIHVPTKRLGTTKTFGNGDALAGLELPMACHFTRVP